MKATELRIGNLVNYQLTDKLSDPKNWIEPMVVDAEDLRVLSLREYDDYSPIPLTEEWLKRFPFKEICRSDYQVKYLIEAGRSFINISFRSDGEICVFFNNIMIKHINSVHQLQNLYFAITGEELTIKIIEP